MTKDDTESELASAEPSDVDTVDFLDISAATSTQPSQMSPATSIAAEPSDVDAAEHDAAEPDEHAAKPHEHAATPDGHCADTSNDEWLIIERPRKVGLHVSNTGIHMVIDMDPDPAVIEDTSADELTASYDTRH